MKIIKTSVQKDIAKRLIHLTLLTHLRFRVLNDDLAYEFGEDVLNKKVGKSKSDEKLYQTLRDHFSSIIEELIIEELNLVHDLGLDEDNFCDDLDLIFRDSKIYDGLYNRWSSISPNIESMELDTGIKYWWSKKMSGH